MEIRVFDSGANFALDLLFQGYALCAIVVLKL
jgi:hypothetical protein